MTQGTRRVKRAGQGACSARGSWWVAVFAVLALTLTGCGFGEESGTPTVSTTSTRVASVAAPTAANNPGIMASPGGMGAATATISGPTAMAAPLFTPTARPPAATPTPQPGPKPTPKGDQSLTMIGPSVLPETLDPALVRETTAAFLSRQVFRGLVRLDNALNPVPDIAADYEKSADGRVFTFYLRTTAKFQNGKQITADDVAFSLKRACDPAIAGGRPVQTLPASGGLNDVVGCTDRLAGRVSDVAGIIVRDPLTVVITIDAPKASFLSKLTLSDAFVIDRNDLTRGPTWWQTANGSGPFKLTTWKPDMIVLTRNPTFYDQVATLERVTLLLGAQTGNPANLYDANKVDIAPIGLADVDRVSAPNSPTKDQLRAVAQLETVYIGINLKQTPLDQFNVRAALIRTLDRARLQTAKFNGRATEAKGIVPPGIPGGDWSATIPTVDGKTAKMLLPPDAAKGLPAITFGSGDGTDDVLGPFVKSLAEQNLGVTVNVEDAVRFDDFATELDAHEYGLYGISWAADYPDAENFLTPLFHTGGSANYGSYSNPKVDDLLDRAAVEQSAAQRFTLYKQAQQQIIDDVGVIPMYHPTSYTLVRPYVKGLSITAMGVMRLETVWLEGKPAAAVVPGNMQPKP